MIYFRVDCNSNIGLGHMMRCLNIAKDLISEGENVQFIISQDSDETVLCENKIEYHKLKVINELGWDVDEFISFISSLNTENNIVFLDTYRIDKISMSKILKVSKLIYLDDLAIFDYPANCVINYNLEANYEMYSHTIYRNRKLYLGPSYFPSKKEFLFYKKNKLSFPIRRVLITSSSTDPYETIYKLLSFIETDDFHEIEFNVLIGKFFSKKYIDQLKEISKNKRNIVLLQWGQNIPRLLSQMDLLLAPGSTIMMESLIVGTPCITFSFVDNQLPMCRFVKDNNIAPYLGDFRNILINKEIVKSQFVKMLEKSKLSNYYVSYSSLFDGEGCKRITQIIKKIAYDDIELI